MFKLPHGNINAEALLYSQLFDEKHFYNALARDLKHAQNTVIIESPFITLKRVNVLLVELIKLTERGISVQVNTRSPNCHDEYLRMQAWVGIKVLRSIGVKVKLFDDYRHRKLAIVDSFILWEGSLNILSQNNSREIMRRTVSSELCHEMIRFTGINRWFW